MKLKKLSGENSLSSELRFVEQFEDCLDSEGGDEVLADNFLFLEYLLELASLRD